MYFPYLRLLHQALDKVRQHQRSGTSKVVKCTVLRGARADLVAERPLDYEEGNSMFWCGVSSCTTDTETMKQFLGDSGDRTLFVIHTEQAVDVQRLSAQPMDP